jgi:uroporphyrinogen-III synthase
MIADRNALHGVTVLLLRPAAAALANEQQFRALGAHVQVVPLTQTTALNSEHAQSSILSRVDAFTWVVLSSANGARYFADALRSAASSPASLSARVACVGPATAAAWRTHGGSVALLPRAFRAEVLAAELVPKLCTADSVLLAGAREPRDTLARALQAARIAHESLALYVTEPARTAGPALRDVLYAHSKAPHALVVVFTAPSSVRALVDLLGPDAATLLATTCRCAIGPTTAQELALAGVPATLLAPEANMLGVLAAVRAWHATHAG